MHIIQTKIFEKLVFNERLRFSELRPARVESNLFVYHLKQLIKDGLIEKQDRYYTMTPQGMAYTDRISYKTMKERKQPKIITMLDITNDCGETVLYRRQHQPYIGMVGYPSGKVHMEDRIADAAQREVREKIGFACPVTLQHCGDVYVAISKNGFLISRVLGHVFVGRTNQPIENTQTNNVVRFWADYTTIEAHEMLPGMPEIKHSIASGSFFFAELSFDL